MFKVNINHYGSTVANIEADSQINLTCFIIDLLTRHGAIDDEADEIAIAENVIFCNNEGYFYWSGFLFTFSKV